MLRILTCTFVFSCSIAIGAPDSSSDLAKELALSEQAVELDQAAEELINSTRPYDSDTMDRVDSLISALVEQGRLTQVIYLLERQVSTARVSKGLLARDQLPYLKSLLDLLSMTGNWNALNDKLTYITWLNAHSDEFSIPEKLESLGAVADWHLTGLAEDKNALEAYHLLQYRDLQETRLQLAEGFYSSNTEAIAPYIYDNAMASLYIGLSILNTVTTREELIQHTEGIAVTARNKLSGVSLSNFNAYYGASSIEVIERAYKSNIRQAIIELTQLREQFATEGNTEAAAMTAMQIGDLILIEYQFTPRAFTRIRKLRGSPNIGRAMTHYRDALELLAQSGYSPERITQFVHCPQIVPLPQILLSLSEQDQSCTSELNQSAETIDFGTYSTLSPISAGLNNRDFRFSELVSADIELQIAGNGQATRGHIVALEPNSRQNRQRIKSALSNLQFRPRIVEDKHVPIPSARIRIEMPAAP
jgi:hypothetical protein